MASNTDVQDTLAGQAGIQQVQLQPGAGAGAVRQSLAYSARTPNVTTSARVVDALGVWASGKLKAAADVAHERSMLEGTIQQQQGASFKDVQMQGDKWATEGFRQMDAQSMSSSLLAAQQQAITNGDFALNPDQYRTQLGDRLASAVEGTDPRTAQLVREQMSKQVPALIQQQTAAWVANNEAQTYNSLIRSVDVISRDPSAADALVAFATGADGSPTAGMSPARRADAVTNGVLTAFANGNPGAYAVLQATGALSGLSLAQQDKLARAQRSFDTRQRSVYNAEFEDKRRALAAEISAGTYTAKDAAEKYAALEAEYGITMTAAEGRAVGDRAVTGVQTARAITAANYATAKASGDVQAMVDLTLPVLGYIESNNNPNALGPVVTAGANAGDRAGGEYQVMPKTAADPGFGVRPAADTSTAELNRVGKDYWTMLLTGSAGNSTLLWAPGDWEAAAVAHNAGPANANRWIKAGRDYSVLPDRAQTEDYVNKFRVRFQGADTPGAQLTAARARMSAVNDAVDLNAYEAYTSAMSDLTAGFESGTGMSADEYRAAAADLGRTFNIQRTTSQIDRMQRVIDNADTSALTPAQATEIAGAAGAVVAQTSAAVAANPDMSAGDLTRLFANAAQAIDTFVAPGGQAAKGAASSAQAALQSGLQRALDEQQVRASEGIAIASAIRDGTVSNLPPKLQDRVWSTFTKQATKDYTDAVAAGGNQADAAAALQAKVTKGMADFNYVPPDTVNSMSAAFTGMMVDKQGNVNPLTIQAYNDYTALAAQSMTTAAKALTPAAREIMHAIDTRVAGQDAGNVQAAIAAVAQMPRRSPAEVTAALASEAFNASLDGAVSAALAPSRGWFTTDRADGISADTEAQVKQVLRTQAQRIAQTSSLLDPAAIADQALAVFKTSSAVVNGDVVTVASPGTSLSTAVFGDKAGQYWTPTVLQDVLDQWVQTPEFAASNPWVSTAKPSVWTNNQDRFRRAVLGQAFKYSAATTADGTGVWISVQLPDGTFREAAIPLAAAGSAYVRASKATMIGN